MKAGPGWIASLCLCGWLALGGSAGHALAANGVQGVADARFILADDDTPPVDDRPWAPVTLPDNWSTSRRDAQGIGWYRMVLPPGLAAPGRTAVLIKRLSMNAEIFVNGVRVLSGGRMTDPVTRNWNVPFFVEIPASMLSAGQNVIDVRLFAYRNNNGGLGVVHAGDAATLRAEHAWLNALHVKGAVLSFAVALMAAFMGVAAWWRMGREPLYGLFGLAMVAWVVRYANYFWQDVPFDGLAYSVAVNSAQGWFFVFFTPFFLRLAKLHWALVERGLLLMGVAGTVGIYTAFRGWTPLWLVILMWSFVWIPGALALLAVSARHACKTRSALAALAALVVWLYVPLTFRELLITSGYVSFDGSYIAHYVGVPLALLISLMLIDRVVSAAQAAASAELARARAAFDERQRITQDMHDGLGLQLNAALRVVERGTLDRATCSGMLRACLDELRLIVDSSDAESGDFLVLLASLRIRLQPRLEAMGVRIAWQMEDFPQGLSLPAGESLQVLRIVQEAINNTIKHASASVITFRVGTSAEPGHVALRVCDDGVGFVAGSPGAGKGLIGMQRRATAAGVGLLVASTAAGTCIHIDIPDPRRTSMAAATLQART